MRLNGKFDSKHMDIFLPSDPIDLLLAIGNPFSTGTSTNRYLPSARLIAAARVEMKRKIEFIVFNAQFKFDPFADFCNGLCFSELPQNDTASKCLSIFYTYTIRILILKIAHLYALTHKLLFK